MEVGLNPRTIKILYDTIFDTQRSNNTDIYL